MSELAANMVQLAVIPRCVMPLAVLGSYFSERFRAVLRCASGNGLVDPVLFESGSGRTSSASPSQHAPRNLCRTTANCRAKSLSWSAAQRAWNGILPPMTLPAIAPPGNMDAFPPGVRRSDSYGRALSWTRSRRNGCAGGSGRLVAAVATWRRPVASVRRDRAWRRVGPSVASLRRLIRRDMV